MTAEFTIHFDSAEEFLRLLQLLKESGIKHFTFKPVIRQKKQPEPEKRDWSGAGAINLGSSLDHSNIRDLAYGEFWEKTVQSPSRPQI